MKTKDIIGLIKSGTIHGPHSNKFKRDEWITLLESELTEDEKNLIVCGLIFDEQLCVLRSESNIKDFKVDNNTFIQCAIAVVTSNVNLAKRQLQDKLTQFGNLIDVMKPAINGERDNLYTIDEAVTSLGDSLNLVLKAKLKNNSINNSDAKASINCSSLVRDVCREIEIASCYLMHEEYWNRCVHFGYQFYGDEQIRFASKNVDFEKTRTVSTFRHRKLLTDESVFNCIHLEKLPNELKMKFARQALVIKASGNQIIDSIEVGFSTQAYKNSVPALWARTINEQSFYSTYLQTAQSVFGGLNFSQLISGWCFLQSLACELNKNNPTFESELGVENFKVISPQISSKALISALAKSTNTPNQIAEKIIQALTFEGKQSQDLWSQPLLKLETNFCLAIPCIQSTHLERVLESWMHQASFDFGLKGNEFEKYCHRQLEEAIINSELKDKTKMSLKSVKLKYNGKIEDIDIVIVIDERTVLIVEAKCILWPDSALQFSRYQEAVEFGVSQIFKKKIWIESNKEKFVQILKNNKIQLSQNFHLEACVLTNSAILAGFPQNGIAVVDLAILTQFFTNRHCVIANVSFGEIKDEVIVRFFENLDNIDSALHSYLQNPPQLDLYKKYVSAREVILPIDFRNKSVTFDEMVVDVNAREVLNSYGIG